MSKKLLALAALVAVCSLLVVAQTQQHGILLGITPSPTAGVALTEVWRAPCTGPVSGSACPTGGVYGKVASIPAASTSFDDAGLQPGTAWDYYLVSVCPSDGCGNNVFGSSVPSVHAAAVAGKDPNAGSLTAKGY